MALTPRVRNRKRVCAILRAPDGSAFQNCETCGVSVAVALADMHHCESKMEPKRFKGIDGTRRQPQSNHGFRNLPISPYRIFMESFMKGREKEDYIKMDRIGFEKWKSMSEEEKRPYVALSGVSDYVYQEDLDREANEIIKVNDGADSSMAKKKVDKSWIVIESSDSEEDSEESSDSEDSEESSDSEDSGESSDLGDSVGSSDSEDSEESSDSEDSDESSL
ncbi:High mobility group box domain superfamily [Sesbania bispinosa]|nr:High mobility group box domain superfamily [Sesbania bispinosa]